MSDWVQLTAGLPAVAILSEASHDFSSMFIELGAAIVGLAILARVAMRMGFSARMRLLSGLIPARIVGAVLYVFNSVTNMAQRRTECRVTGRVMFATVVDARDLQGS